jgi:hypothetical protein
MVGVIVAVRTAELKYSIPIQMQNLNQDLNTGAWDDSYGQLRQRDIGYRFLHMEAVP